MGLTSRLAITMLVAIFAGLLYPAAGNCAQERPPSTPPPVSAEELMKAVDANQKQIEELRKNYIFHRRDEEPTYDSQGHVKSTDVREYEVYYLGPWEIDRLLTKNGKPLSEGENRREQNEVQREEAEARKRIARQASGQAPAKDEITMAKFLADDRFFNLRRDTYEGREVYAIDFGPRPDFEPHSMVERVLKSMGGTLWIDEQAKQAVRLEARFLQGLKVGGGVLGAIEKGGNVILEQRFVNNEVWMPSYLEVHLNARVLFLHKPINIISKYSDYRKFEVHSKIAMLRVCPNSASRSVMQDVVFCARTHPGLASAGPTASITVGRE